MQSNYKRLGDYIQEVNIKNTDLKVSNLIGVSIEKKFIKSVANMVGVDISKYKIIHKNQLACKLMSVGRDEKLPVDLYTDEEPSLVSSAYYVFEPIDNSVLLPEYLKMWLFRSETDRYVGYVSGGDVRGGISWDTFCEIPIKVPSLEKQQKIVAEYNTIQNRIELNNQLITKLEETAQAIYKQWFVDFEFPHHLCHAELVSASQNATLGYKSSGGKMVWCEELEKEIPEGWELRKLKSICSKIGSGSTPPGGKESYFNSGTSLIRSMNIYDFNFSYENLAFIDNQQADKLKNVEVIENDILFNITGVSVARCCIVPKTILPARVNQHVMIIRPKEFSLNYYLLCTLCSNQSKNELLGISQSGSTREAITKADIEDFKILLPTSEILKKNDGILSRLFTLKDSISTENQKLEELKELLLGRMVKES